MQLPRGGGGGWVRRAQDALFLWHLPPAPAKLELTLWSRAWAWRRRRGSGVSWGLHPLRRVLQVQVTCRWDSGNGPATPGPPAGAPGSLAVHNTLMLRPGHRDTWDAGMAAPQPVSGRCPQKRALGLTPGMSCFVLGRAHLKLSSVMSRSFHLGVLQGTFIAIVFRDPQQMHVGYLSLTPFKSARPRKLQGSRGPGTPLPEVSSLAYRVGTSFGHFVFISFSYTFQFHVESVQDDLQNTSRHSSCR